MNEWRLDLREEQQNSTRTPWVDNRTTWMQWGEDPAMQFCAAIGEKAKGQRVPLGVLDYDESIELRRRMAMCGPMPPTPMHPLLYLKRQLRVLWRQGLWPRDWPDYDSLEAIRRVQPVFYTRGWVLRSDMSPQPQLLSWGKSFNFQVARTVEKFGFSLVTREADRRREKFPERPPLLSIKTSRVQVGFAFDVQVAKEEFGMPEGGLDKHPVPPVDQAIVRPEVDEAMERHVPAPILKWWRESHEP